MADKKLWTTETMITDRVMHILRPLYRNKQLHFDEKKNEIVEKFSESDKIREFLLNTMAERASSTFLDRNNTYASFLFSVAEDCLQDCNNGELPGFDKKEEVLAFFEENQKDFIKKAERLCGEQEMYFEDIPGFNSSDRRIKTEANKLAVTQFVMNYEIWSLHKEMMEYRNELETIPRISTRKDRLRTSLKQSVSLKQDNDMSR